MSLAIVAPDMPGPHSQTHTARMSPGSHVIGLVSGLLITGFLITLMVKEGMPQTDAHWFMYGNLAVVGIPVTIIYLRTLWLMAKGIPAGIRISEEPDHILVVFFSGRRPCRVQRFAYAEILDHGVTKVDTGAASFWRPFVAIPGHIRRSAKETIPLGALCDMRRLHPIYSQVLAADIARIMERHPQPRDQRPSAAATASAATR